MNNSLANAYVNKSEIYANARPLYPQEAIMFIHSQLDLPQGLPVVDVGAGTGILSRQLAATGLSMIGVEPDEQMLAKARAHSGPLAAEYRWGSEEHLGMASGSVAALVCGQSFHWFGTDRTLSCSYAAQPGTPEFASASNALKALHQEYEQQGNVSLNYGTRVVYGRI